MKPDVPDMTWFSYDRFQSDKPELRDFLAMDRTILANERTLLAYLRTAMALAIVGGSAIKFFDSPVLHVSGGVLIVMAIWLMVVGVRRFGRTNKRIRAAIGPRPRTPAEAEKERQTTDTSE